MRFLILYTLVGTVACGSIIPATYTAEQLPRMDEFTEEWGCGFGFYISDAEQTRTVRVTFIGDGDPTDVDLPHPDWEARLVEGTNLYANWCNDFIDETQPQPIIHWEHPIVEGSLSIMGEPPEPFSGGELTLGATNLVVELPSGARAALGDVEITNPNYGFLAG